MTRRISDASPYLVFIGYVAGNLLVSVQLLWLFDEINIGAIPRLSKRGGDQENETETERVMENETEWENEKL